MDGRKFCKHSVRLGIWPWAITMAYRNSLIGNDIDTVTVDHDGAIARWRKKAIQARVMTGILTVLCCVLIVVLVINYETRHSRSQPVTKATKRASGHISTFLLVSDFHYDPFYNKTVPSKKYFCRPQGVSQGQGVNNTATYVAPYGRIGCDAPMALVDITLDAMKNVTSGEAAFLLLTGDSSGHRMWTSYAGPDRVIKNMITVTNKTHTAFPNIPVFPLIGNNDLPGHYILPNSTSDWYKTILSFWGPLILCSACSTEVKHPTSMEALQETFLEGGYYNASIGDGKMVLLVLNSMYWSVAVQHNLDIQQKAVKQMMWLRDQLQSASDQGRKAILTGHIPPGIDSYDMKPFWFNNYTEEYVDLVANVYKDIVAGQLFGHIHKDDFRLQISHKSKGEGTAESFLLLAPSISPVYRNNPAFRMVSMDTEQQALLDYTQYYMDLVMATEFSNPVWQEDYTFSQKYPSSKNLIDAERIQEFNQQLINQTSDAFWTGYIISRETNYQPLPYSRFVLYCAMRYVFLQDFEKCVENYSVPGG